MLRIGEKPFEYRTKIKELGTFQTSNYSNISNNKLFKLQTYKI